MMFSNNTILSKILLVIVFFLGFFFRLNNLSVFNLYPDSYQSLIVAKNITMYHSVVGYFGPHGMLYPDFFMWTHPVYPLLINSINIPIHNMLATARLIALLAGIGAIPLSFFFIKRVFQSTPYGLTAAFFIAFSLNHTIWSGFIMTETTGVCMLLLFLLTFFARRTSQKFGDPLVILSGILFAIVVLSRYEYTVILFPLALYLFFNGKQLM